MLQCNLYLFIADHSTPACPAPEAQLCDIKAVLHRPKATLCSAVLCCFIFQELEVWTTDFVLPVTVWLAGFFNPQSFLTAIMQSMARKNEWPLDKMCLAVEVTKKNREDMTAPPREGSYVHGLFMEGKRLHLVGDVSGTEKC